MRKFSFEKLMVWEKAQDFVIQIYRVTKKFPEEENYGLKRQLRRSAISVPSNIAEGSSRKSDRDKARFLEIAYGSLMENLNQLILSRKLNYISDQDLEELREMIEEIGRMMNGLRKTFLK